MSEISEYKEECMRRFKETQKYQKYDKEDLIDELYEKDNLLHQKENKEKEIREYILTHKLYCFKYDEEELFEITTDKKAKDELLEILDKEVN